MSHPRPLAEQQDRRNGAQAAETPNVGWTLSLQAEQGKNNPDPRFVAALQRALKERP